MFCFEGTFGFVRRAVKRPSQTALRLGIPSPDCGIDVGGPSLDVQGEHFEIRSADCRSSAEPSWTLLGSWKPLFGLLLSPVRHRLPKITI